MLTWAGGCLKLFQKALGELLQQFVPHLRETADACLHIQSLNVNSTKPSFERRHPGVNHIRLTHCRSRCP